jgi:hypothetical protein
MWAAARQVLYNWDGAVVGVGTNDFGVAKDGSRKATYAPGVDLIARATLLAEGCRGSLSQQVGAWDLGGGRGGFQGAEGLGGWGAGGLGGLGAAPAGGCVGRSLGSGPLCAGCCRPSKQTLALYAAGLLLPSVQGRQAPPAAAHPKAQLRMPAAAPLSQACRAPLTPCCVQPPMACR